MTAPASGAPPIGRDKSRIFGPYSGVPYPKRSRELEYARSATLAFALLAGCASAPPPAPQPAPAPPARACEDAYEDLKQYYEADPERHRPAGFHAPAFLHACREMAPAAQRCLLFSYMQAHAKECEDALAKEPDAMRRIATMTGK